VPATSGFLTADGATSGSGGTITYSYPANSGVQRAANVTVGDQTVTVTQLAHDQTPTDDVVVYYHTDAIGSVRLVTDANGAPMRAHDFLPFGQDTPAGPNGTDTFLFAGHERDAGVASDYFGARFYSSFAERFATPDPLSITDERVGEPYRLNRYAYAHNNPLRFVDPSGLDPECQEIGALGVVCTDGIVVTATSSDAEKQLVRQRLAMQQAIKDAHSLRVELGSEGGGTLPSADPQPEGPSDTVKWQRIACTLDAGLNFGLSTFVPGYGLLKEVALLANFNIRPFSMAARISPPATAGHTAPSAAAAIASGYWLYRDSMVNWDDLNKLRDWTSRTNSGGENMLKYGARLSSLEKLASAAKFASRVTVGLSAISSAYDVYKCWAD
jgi:RHS repeat-associated protein